MFWGDHPCFPLAVSSLSVKRTPLRRRSKKREQQDREYAAWRKGYLARNPHCMAKWAPDCWGRASEVNHIIKRSQGAPAVPRSESDVMSICRPCHARIDLYPQEAKDRGFIRRQTW